MPSKSLPKLVAEHEEVARLIPAVLDAERPKHPASGSRLSAARRAITRLAHIAGTRRYKSHEQTSRVAIAAIFEREPGHREAAQRVACVARNLAPRDEPHPTTQRARVPALATTRALQLPREAGAQTEGPWVMSAGEVGGPLARLAHAINTARRLTQNARGVHLPAPPADQLAERLRAALRLLRDSKRRAQAGAATTLPGPKGEKCWPTWRRVLWRRDPHCFRCGRLTVFEAHNVPRAATVEHVYPKSHPRRRDARRHLPLLVLACYRCNVGRGAPAPVYSSDVAGRDDLLLADPTANRLEKTVQQQRWLGQKRLRQAVALCILRCGRLKKADERM